MVRKDFFWFIFLMVLPGISFATHNRAGEIQIQQVGDCNNLTIKATIITYTKASSVMADRDSLTICWGDGTCEQIPRTNGNPGSSGVPQGIFLPNDTKKNLYVAYHTYSSSDSYLISCTDPNRNAGILNVNYPGSEEVPFHIQTSYTFLNAQFQGCNNTPTLLQPPIDFACEGKPFFHNPNAFDPDGDSLSYHLIVPLQDIQTVVPNYKFPTQISPGSSNTLTLDVQTGTLIWDAPQVAGEYNIAFIIVSYRNGSPIDTTIRDMQIFVLSCADYPPLISADQKICIIAGSYIDLPVVATDEEAPPQKLKLTALGGPLTLDTLPAIFSAKAEFQDAPVTANFTWQTHCRHIKPQPYQVIFKAVDNLYDTSGLAYLHNLQIKVVGPPPLNVNANPQGTKILVTWEFPYACDSFPPGFRGFTVWRKIGSNQFPLDTCVTGLEGKGYNKISNIVKQENSIDYFFEDSDVTENKTYCYRVLAEYAQFSSGGNPFNKVESLPSNEVCTNLKRDVPFITHVSVTDTDPTSGQIYISWIMPESKDYDTITHQGPYRLRLFRSSTSNAGPWIQVPGGGWTIDHFYPWVDTVFIDSKLNTTFTQYYYYLDFASLGINQIVDSSSKASSVYLNTNMSTNAIQLSWNENVPWNNYEYTVYKKDEFTGLFNPIGNTSTQNFIDTVFEFGKNYCYAVTSKGSYGIQQIPSPLLNDSEIKCIIPLDTFPPCSPFIAVTNPCDASNPPSKEDAYFNTITWTMDPNCPTSNDVVSYEIYYSPASNQQLVKLTTISAPLQKFDHLVQGTLEGCYSVIAIDAKGNKSPLSNTICKQNCPQYTLPNTFTPDQNNQNDLFKPFPYRFVQSIEFSIYNRWGNLIWETKDPDINWDGTNLEKKKCADGVYFYVCKVFPKSSDSGNAQPMTLKGFIQLFNHAN